MHSRAEELKQTNRACDQTESCVRIQECEPLSPKYSRIKKLQSQGDTDIREYVTLKRELSGAVCNKKNQGVCCTSDQNVRLNEEGSCGINDKCVSTKNCDFFQEENKILNYYKDHGDDGQRISLAKELRGRICNKKSRRVCCPPNLGPTDLPQLGNCGRDRVLASRIVGGNETFPGQYPFLALLGFEYRHRSKLGNRQIETTSNTWVCAGTLINKWHVLTAAHCIKAKNEITKLALGEWRVLGYGGAQPKEFPKVQYFDIDASLTTVHEGYNTVYENDQKNVVNDIALIRLPRQAQLNVLVQMACLPAFPEEFRNQLNVKDEEADLVGEKASVVGWGKTDAHQLTNRTGVGSRTQLFVKLPILSTRQCKATNNGFIPRKSQICAGEIGKDACRGDSGGGIFIRGDEDEDEDKPWYAIGIVSFGSRDCGNGIAGVYTRISEFIPWIKKNLR